VARDTRSQIGADAAIAAIEDIADAVGAFLSAAFSAVRRWLEPTPPYGGDMGTDPSTTDQEDAALVADPLSRQAMEETDRMIAEARSHGEDAGTALRRAGYRPLADVMRELGDRTE
jgi:hypothetical protein